MLRPSRDPATGRRFLATSQLRDYYAATLTVRQPLVLAHLADDGLAQAGIDQRVTGGDDYALSQAWAKAIHEHEGTVDGILFPSRHHNTLYAVALFGRAADRVTFRRWGSLGDRRARGLWSDT